MESLIRNDVETLLWYEKSWVYRFTRIISFETDAWKKKWMFKIELLNDCRESFCSRFLWMIQEDWINNNEEENNWNVKQIDLGN